MKSVRHKQEITDSARQPEMKHFCYLLNDNEKRDMGVIPIPIVDDACFTNKQC